jgi:Ice-binding-like
MSRPIHLKRGLAGIVAAGALALFAIPATALAAPVNLATAEPFVVLAGTTVTNTGPSVLNGDLGVAPGTAVTGFGLPAVVNGATHEADAVAAQAQSDLTNAYTVASEQPVAPADDLSGTNLGNRILGPGAYRYTAAALMTGALTLDAEGDPNAQFVFEIGSELTTESASSVLLINGASPCNVYWQVGSSADIGTTTTFVGNLMALTSISLKNGATVVGRMLARNGQVSLINNVLTKPLCATGTTVPPGVVPPGGSETGTSPAGVTPASSAPAAGSPGTTSPAGPPRSLPAKHAPNHKPNQRGRAVGHPTPRQACTDGFHATVNGRMIDRVVFSLDGKTVLSDTNSPFAVSVRAAPGAHTVRARVTFKDSTPPKTMSFPYRACAAAVLAPPAGPSTFTG